MRLVASRWLVQRALLYKVSYFIKLKKQKKVYDHTMDLYHYFPNNNQINYTHKLDSSFSCVLLENVK